MDDKAKLLLIDDDLTLIQALELYLARAGYEVYSASNGAEGLRQLYALRPDLVVLDVMMDHLSEGFDVARKLKGDPRTGNIPVVMLTGVDQVYDYRMEIDESFMAHDRFLEKPVEPEELLATLKEVCEMN